MTLPKWNNEWEQSDPLQGKLGWSWRRYLSVGISMLLLMTFCGVVIPAIVKLRHEKMIKDSFLEVKHKGIDMAIRESLSH